MSRAEMLKAKDAGAVEALVAATPKGAGAVNAANLGPTLAAEVCRLDGEGRELLIQAARMARDARPEFEAWFEAGLQLRRASERLAQIVQNLDPREETSTTTATC